MKCLKCDSVFVTEDKCCNCGDLISPEDRQFTDGHLYCEFCSHKEFRHGLHCDMERNFCKELLDVDSRITYAALVDWSDTFPKPIQREKRGERLIPSGSLKMFTSITAGFVLEMLQRIKPFIGPMRYYIAQYEQRVVFVYGTSKLFLVLIIDSELEPELLQRVTQATKDLEV